MTDVEELDEVEEFANHPFIDDIVTVGAYQYTVDNDMRCVGTYAAGTWVTPPVPPRVNVLLSATPLNVHHGQTTVQIIVQAVAGTFGTGNWDIYVDGVKRTTTFVSSSSLRASNLVMPATGTKIDVEVRDAVSGAKSNIIAIPLTPFPMSIASIVPSSGAPSVNIPLFTVNGTGFIATSKIHFDDIINPKATTYVSPTQLTAANVTPGPVPGALKVFVRNPDWTQSPMATFNAALTELSVADVKAWVDANPDFADEVLELEQQHQNRVTLVDWLRGFISHRDEGTR